MWYINGYICTECGANWEEDTMSSAQDELCPNCGTSTFPYKSYGVEDRDDKEGE